MGLESINFTNTGETLQDLLNRIQEKKAILLATGKWTCARASTVLREPWKAHMASISSTETPSCSAISSKTRWRFCNEIDSRSVATEGSTTIIVFSAWRKSGMDCPRKSGLKREEMKLSLWSRPISYGFGNMSSPPYQRASGKGLYLCQKNQKANLRNYL